MLAEQTQSLHADELAPGAAAVEFGATLASGDFDGDDFVDLVVGDPLAAVGGELEAGAVYVIYGSATGLDTSRTELWTQDTSGVVDEAEDGDRFGFSLAVGDFNCDTHLDLAVGAPGDRVGSVDDAGAVTILFGSESGLTAASQRRSQDSSGVAGAAEAGDEFGYALASGHYDSLVSCTDLAIGIPGEDDAGAIDKGNVQVFYGSLSGLGSNEDTFEQGFGGLEDADEAGDRFGHSLASGDFNGDSIDDLAIGVPFEDLPPQPGGNGTDVGAVQVVLGTASGLTTVGNKLWDQRDGSVLGGFDGNEQFGFAITAGDFNDDGLDDLAIGAPGEPLSSGADAGWINVLYGADVGLSDGGLTDAGNQTFSQGFGGLLGVEGAGHRFGESLAAADVNGDGLTDVLIGAPGDTVSDSPGAGSIHVLYDVAVAGTVGDQRWNQRSPWIGDLPSASERFGAALAAGDFDGDGADDVATGVPAEDGVGGVDVVYTLGPGQVLGDDDSVNSPMPHVANVGASFVALWNSFEDPGLVYRLSADGGDTWGSERRITDAVYVWPRMVGADNGVWIVTANSPGIDAQIDVFRSGDAGSSWSDRVLVGVALPSGISNLLNRPQIATDGSGRWMVTWIDTPGGVGLATSADDGLTWSAEKSVLGSGFLGDVELQRMESPTEGIWTSVWVEDDGSAYSARSTDLGDTWSTPQLITTGPTRGCEQLTKGSAGVLYCTTLDASGDLLQLFESVDAGASWTIVEAVSVESWGTTGAVAYDGSGVWRAISSAVPVQVADFRGSEESSSTQVLDSFGGVSGIATNGDGQWVAAWATDEGGAIGSIRRVKSIAFPTPEPSMTMGFLSGLLGLALMGRRRGRRPTSGA